VSLCVFRAPLHYNIPQLWYHHPNQPYRIWIPISYRSFKAVETFVEMESIDEGLQGEGEGWCGVDEGMLKR
jgi:hypothetical protein